MSSVIAELLPYDCQNFNVFSVLSHNLETHEWNFLKLILNIYDHSVVMNVMFHLNVVGYRELLPFDCLNFSDFPSSAITR